MSFRRDHDASLRWQRWPRQNRRPLLVWTVALLLTGCSGQPPARQQATPGRPSTPPKDKAKETLDRYMDQDFKLFACGKDAPSEAELTTFEKNVGFPLPSDFRAFSMSPSGGVYIEVKEALWPRPKAYDVGPFWSFLYGLHTYGFGKGIPDWMDIRIESERFQKETG
jgi:hypothetical protein